MTRVLRWVLRVCLGGTVLLACGLLWLMTDWPTGLDRWLNVSTSPERAAAIVVLAGGTNGRNLPLQQGWDRLQTAADLYADGWAPVVIVSGGGTSKVSEAEIYANAAAWLGIPRTAVRIETGAQRTADHGPKMRGYRLPDGTTVGPDTPLILVTSPFHSRRARASFLRAGLNGVRVVSGYTPQRPGRERQADRAPDGVVAPAALTSSVQDHQASGKRYNDMLFHLQHRSFNFFRDLREVAALWLE